MFRRSVLHFILISPFSFRLDAYTPFTETTLGFKATAWLDGVALTPGAVAVKGGYKLAQLLICIAGGRVL